MKRLFTALLMGLSIGTLHAAAITENFDTPALTGWKWLHDTDGWPNQLAKQETKNGNLILEPYTSTWTGAFHGPFLYQEVSGDFIASMRVKVEGLTGPDFRWRNIGSKAGFLVRSPTKPASTWQPEDENYLLFVAGDVTYCVPCIDLVGVKKGRTAALINNGAAGWVNLRLVRIGKTFIALYQLGTAPWAVMQYDEDRIALNYKGFSGDLYKRDDMPDTVQVGLTALADSPTLDGPVWQRLSEKGELARKFNLTVIKDGEKRDARAFFDTVSIKPFTPPKAWKGKNLNDIKPAALALELGKD